jgi:hypothetical protein
LKSTLLSKRLGHPVEREGYQLQLTFQGHTMEEPTDAPEWFDSAITQMVDEDCPIAEVETPWKDSSDCAAAFELAGVLVL